MMARISRRCERASARGFTYVGLLLAIAIAGVALAAAGVLWSTEAKRERERELLFAGDQIRLAIASYYALAPNTYPSKLDDLVLDKRLPTVLRHLRKVYADPITGKRDWGYVRGPGETIVGVYSKSADAPLKQAGFPKEYESFEGAKAYSDWKFAHVPAQVNQGSKKAGATTSTQQGAPQPGGQALGGPTSSPLLSAPTPGPPQ